VGSVMDFGTKDHGPIRIFGLPKNMLLEVRTDLSCVVGHISDFLSQFRLLSKPCSVIRDVTLTAIDMVDTANIKPSRETRVVLSEFQNVHQSPSLLTI
jgi:small subunit ribosomal protein S29